jgi:hypothetical protein
VTHIFMFFNNLYVVEFFFWSEAHASCWHPHGSPHGLPHGSPSCLMGHPCWQNWIFFLKTCTFKGEAHVSPLLNNHYVVELVILEWRTCLTFVDRTTFVFNLWFENEAHASSLLNSIYVAELGFLEWGTCLTLVDKTKILKFIVIAWNVVYIYI